MGGTMSVTNLQLRIPNEATLPVPTTPTRKRKFPSLASPKRSPRRTKHSKVGFIRTGIFPFLFLPGEIRNQIYAHVLLFQDRGRYARDELSGTMRLHQVSTHASPFCASDLMSDEVYYGRRLGIPTAVLRVCKQMHAEAMDVMYQNAFLVDIDYRKAVFSQSSTTVATFWKTDRSVGSPLSIPRQWAVTRITRLHLRIEMHAQGPEDHGNQCTIHKVEREVEYPTPLQICGTSRCDGLLPWGENGRRNSGQVQVFREDASRRHPKAC
ncbi:hypothetical protein K504DRAFT_452586 [Pleomassaria siparia CBS 279.74]|uniref:Uncharacterized protein n=1 Tax=Pleomassaria siparia CBS 279.74 TaxID=1314801 RepID=A0A6G1KJ14_9PLEO|nr:hypothetical protein K504DRAFT_452586 [Pleomassaria siparia CBS 279.74]